MRSRIAPRRRALWCGRAVAPPRVRARVGHLFARPRPGDRALYPDRWSLPAGRRRPRRLHRDGRPLSVAPVPRLRSSALKACQHSARAGSSANRGVGGGGERSCGSARRSSGRA